MMSKLCTAPRAARRRRLAAICDRQLAEVDLKAIGQAFEAYPAAMLEGVDRACEEFDRQEAKGTKNGELGAAITLLGLARRLLDKRGGDAA